MRLGCVLMASGSGARFGGNKLLAPAEGVPLFRRALQVLPPPLLSATAVVSCYSEILSQGARLGCRPVPNPLAEEGQSASIRLGLAALGQVEGALFLVCDQPWLTRASVERLIAAWQGAPDAIAALAWRGERGNPVIFPAALFPELAALSGDVGGGRVLRRHLELLRLVEAGSARELRDVDYLADLSFD
jgi:molybdenum cofactor cytidylyltransferase